ncbi:MAG: hypothetical protein E6Q50_02070 [Lysobacter sp.]|nr:MAG: hypothetical protein E6Q50_02070 [Lysobacter sp.]
MGKTAFTDPAAVDAWDLWFRWREGARLRDLTIDATWERVARAVAGAEGADASLWAQRYSDAFSKWQVLPCERLLREAGTGVAVGPAASAPQAALNVSAFVRQSRGTATRFDRDEFVRVCGLTVRFLDDAALTSGHPTTSGLQIGLIGMADALAQLGRGYAGEAACAQAREIASAFAEGCLLGDLALARERGANAVDGKRWGVRFRARGLSAELLADARRYGLRYSRLTAIGSQPRMALLANNIADALDPAVRLSAHERPLAARWRDAGLDRTSPGAAHIAQLELRAAIQPWIDRPIDTPLLALREPDEATRAECAAHAAALGLKTQRWRLLDISTAARVA